MKTLSTFLKNADLKELVSHPNYKSEITNFFKNRDLQNYKLFHINNNFNNNHYHSDNNNNHLFSNQFSSNKFLPITLSNKSVNFNLLDLDDVKEFYNFSFLLEQQQSEKAFIFTGDLENPKHSFCAGANLKFFYSLKNSIENYHLYFNLAYLIVNQLNEFKQKKLFNSIFIWNGVVMGGGLAPGIYAKIRIATESTVLAMPETKFGFYPNILFADFISNFMTKEEALFFALLSHRLNGIEAYVLGFATHFVLDKYVKSLVSEISAVDKANEEAICAIIVQYENRSFEEINNSANEKGSGANENDNEKFYERKNIYGKLFGKFFVNGFMELFASDAYKKNVLEKFEEAKSQLKHKQRSADAVNDFLGFDKPNYSRRLFEDHFFSFDKKEFLEFYAGYEKRNASNSHKEKLKLNDDDYLYLENYFNFNFPNDNKNKDNNKNILLDAIFNIYILNKFSRKIFGGNNHDIIKHNNQEKFSLELFKNFYEKLNFDLIENVAQEKNLLLKNLNFYTLNELNIRSLLSLKQTHEVTLKAYENKSFSEYYDLDLEKSIESFKHGESFEGIRATFIDKDNNPKWKFKTLNDLDKLII